MSLVKPWGMSILLLGAASGCGRSQQTLTTPHNLAVQHRGGYRCPGEMGLHELPTNLCVEGQAKVVLGGYQCPGELGMHELPSNLCVEGPAIAVPGI